MVNINIDYDLFLFAMVTFIIFMFGVILLLAPITMRMKKITNLIEEFQREILETEDDAEDLQGIINEILAGILSYNEPQKQSDDTEVISESEDLEIEETNDDSSTEW